MSCPSLPERLTARALLVALLLAAALAGCQQNQPWRTRSIAHIMPDLAFTLTDQNGRTVHANDYTGKVVMLFFGFSHCHQTCPATLGKLTAVLDKMGKRADLARLLFVSVDPNRDTPARLASYTSAFAPQVIGLTGTQDELQTLTKRYRVAFSYGKGYPHGNYKVYHSGAVFVFDGKGKVRLLFTQTDKISDISADLSRLLAQAASSS
jgi:protein SCO1/2